MLAGLFVLCVVSFCFAGCKEEEKEPIYKVGLTFASMYLPGGIGAHKELTEDNPNFEISIGVHPFNSLMWAPRIQVLEFSDENDELPYIAFSTYFLEEDIEGFELTYTIEKDGQVEKAEYAQNIYSDMYYMDRDKISQPFSELEHKPGKHRLRFGIPSIQPYNTKPVEFEIVFNIAEDTRTEEVEFYIENKENIQYFCSAEETGSLDYYVMNKEPKVAVKEISGERIIGIDPNNELDNRTFENGRYLNEYHGFGKTGYYICRANFKGDEKHPAQYYEFYLLLID